MAYLGGRLVAIRDEVIDDHAPGKCAGWMSRLHPPKCCGTGDVPMWIFHARSLSCPHAIGEDTNRNNFHPKDLQIFPPSTPSTETVHIARIQRLASCNLQGTPFVLHFEAVLEKRVILSEVEGSRRPASDHRWCFHGILRLRSG